MQTTTLEEINMRYRGMYTVLNGELVFIAQCEKGPPGSYSMTYRRLTTDGWVPTKLQFNTVRDIPIVYPNMGLRNMGVYPTYLSIAPLRQYKRGIHAETLIFNTTASKLARYLPRGMVSGSAELTQVFFPKYKEFHNILYEMKQGDILGAAINNRWWVGYELDSKYPVVGYKRSIVGTVDHDKVRLSSKCKHLIEDISQYVNTEIA